MHQDTYKRSVDNVASGRVRYRWFPLLVVAVLLVWWVRQAFYASYHTIFHLVAIVLSCAAISVWYVVFGGARRRVRIWTIGTLWLLGVLFLALFRPVFNGDMGVAGWRLRLRPDADERLDRIRSSRDAADWQTMPRDYPGFLGGGYWAEVTGDELDPDWATHPPEEVWRRAIGSGWSAFAIVGKYAVTQEQRGEQELVSCYRLDTGEPVWVHADEARFDPTDVAGSVGDVGPRATPTVVADRIFTQGGTGIVNCLDARTGDVLWSCDTSEQFDVPVALWGKSGSPLVVNDLVVVSVGAPSDPEADFNSSLVAFDVDTGEVRWKAGSRRAAYATPVCAELAGERQIVVVNESWITAHRAADGVVLWEHPWASEHDRDASVSQPVPVGDDRLFVSKGYGTGASLLSIERDQHGSYSVTPLWNPPIKRVMKTKFSNVLIRNGYVYGLDDVLLACVELDSGKLQWKKRRTPVFGHGQVMLIGNWILVLSESGEVALVEATPDEYREVASFQALDDANITWNNPAFAAPYLVVRNAREAACYKLPLKQTAGGN